MSHNNSIINLLNLKDKNIIFNENFCTDGLVKGVKCKIFYATLTYKPKACYSCGHIFDKKIIKYGFKTSDIKIPNVSGFNAYLRLRKQRYFCKHCNSTFTLETRLLTGIVLYQTIPKYLLLLVPRRKSPKRYRQKPQCISLHSQ